MKRPGTQFKKNRWSEDDTQSFSDGDRLRASTIHGRRRDGPSADEWDYDENETTEH